MIVILFKSVIFLVIRIKKTSQVWFPASPMSLFFSVWSTIGKTIKSACNKSIQVLRILVYYLFHLVNAKRVYESMFSVIIYIRRWRLSSANSERSQSPSRANYYSTWSCLGVNNSLIDITSNNLHFDTLHGLYVRNFTAFPKILIYTGIFTDSKCKKTAILYLHKTRKTLQV